MAFLNLHDYTPLQLAFYATGAYLWVVAYAIYVRNGFKYGVVEMPAFAACGNVGWEINWAIFFVTDLGVFCVWAHRAWFGLDLIIFYLVLRYAHKQTDIPLLKRFWVPVCLFLFAASAVLYGTFVRQGLDVGSTIQSAYICQMPISFLYIPLMLRQKSLVGWSLWTAWTRTLGTGLIGVFAFMRYPDHPFLLSMAVVATLVDFVYIYLLTARRRDRLPAAAPWNRRQSQVDTESLPLLFLTYRVEVPNGSPEALEALTGSLIRETIRAFYGRNQAHGFNKSDDCP